MQADSMTVILVRHGEAASAGGAIHTDDERPLTSRGLEDVTSVGRLLARLEPTPSIILSSPLLRTMQTAHTIASAYAPEIATSVSPLLRPGVRPGELWDELLVMRRAGQSTIIIVGHQPDLGNAVSAFACGSSALSISIVPGTAIRLVGRVSGGRPEAILHWIITPGMARSVTGIVS